MKLSNIFNRAKREVDKRGGVDALKEDASELQGIAKQKGSMGDKAKAAGEAIKDPGAAGPDKPKAGGKPVKVFIDPFPGERILRAHLPTAVAEPLSR